MAGAIGGGLSDHLFSDKKTAPVLKNNMYLFFKINVVL